MDLDAFGPVFFWAKIVLPLVLVLLGLYTVLYDPLLGAGIALLSIPTFLVLDVLQFKSGYG